MESQRLLEILREPDERTFERFLERAYAPLRPADGLPPAVLDKLDLPEPLRRLHELVGARPDILVGHNHFLTVDELERFDGKTVFYEENQSVAFWAYDDAPGVVWTRLVGDRSELRMCDWWHPEPATLPQFLLRAILFDFSISNRYWALSHRRFSEPDVAQTLAPMVRLPLAPWLYQGTVGTFYASDDAVAVVATGPDADPDSFRIQIGSRSLRGVEHIIPMIASDAWFGPENWPQMLN